MLAISQFSLPHMDVLMSDLRHGLDISWSNDVRQKSIEFRKGLNELVAVG